MNRPENAMEWVVAVLWPLWATLGAGVLIWIAVTHAGRRDA